MTTQTTDSRIHQTLTELMLIAGALGAAVVDTASGMALGKTGTTTLDLDIAAAGNTNVIRAQLQVMKEMQVREEIEDILITLDAQYHLLRPLASDTGLFLYVVLNKAQANLALARRQVSKAEAKLVV